MSKIIYKEWDELSEKLKNGKKYEYMLDTIDEQDANNMSKLCDIILQFDDEEKVFEKIEDFAAIGIPIPKVIDTQFLLLHKYPNNEELQAGCVCIIAHCNIYQNATYEKTDYKEGVKLILHAYKYVTKYFDDYDKAMFYRYCLQALRLFAIDHDIFTDEITDIYNMCKKTKVDDEDIIDVDHVYIQLKFQSCYNPEKVFNFLWMNNETDFSSEELLNISKFPFVGYFPNIFMYMIIKQLNRQQLYKIYLEFMKTGVKGDYEKYDKDIKPCNLPYKLEDGTFIMSKIMGELIEEFAPDNVMKKVRKNRELYDNKCEDPDEYQKISFEYAQTDYYINLGLGNPILMYHLIMKFYKIMDEITELKKG